MKTNTTSEERQFLKELKTKWRARGLFFDKQSLIDALARHRETEKIYKDNAERFANEYKRMFFTELKRGLAKRK